MAMRTRSRCSSSTTRRRYRVVKEDWITHGSFNVMVSGGVVELWDWVDSEDERKALMTAVGELDGVQEIVDHLGSVAPYLRSG